LGVEHKGYMVMGTAAVGGKVRRGQEREQDTEGRSDVIGVACFFVSCFCVSCERYVHTEEG